MRGLALYARVTGDMAARRAAERAAGVFLERRLFRRRSNGEVIHPDFVLLHYPRYWHYDFLGGLQGIAVVGLFGDARCAAAPDLPERKELPGGGWASENRYYKVSDKIERNADSLDWGGTNRRRRNDWVTADALEVLHAAGRI